MLMRSSPASSVNVGWSQSRSLRTLAAVASGKSSVPSHGASDSITRVMLASPIFHRFMGSPF